MPASAQETSHDRVWEVIARATVCMMTTRFDGGVRARPLEPRPDREAGVIWFLTDSRGAKDDEIDADPNVCVTIVDDRQKAYLSLAGEASVGRDPDRARLLWNAHQQVWWPGGPEDPCLRVIRFVPHRAELWDGPASAAVAAFEFRSALRTGRKPNLGEKRKVTVRLR